MRRVPGSPETKTLNPFACMPTPTSRAWTARPWPITPTGAISRGSPNDAISWGVHRVCNRSIGTAHWAAGGAGWSGALVRSADRGERCSCGRDDGIGEILLRLRWIRRVATSLPSIRVAGPGDPCCRAADGQGSRDPCAHDGPEEPARIRVHRPGDWLPLDPDDPEVIATQR